ncbi:MAG: hypothetical protein C0404_08885 [Verrucomicrobia bacterium]|nr:hypothetical protein [Verrucomicrobiota bacterium]
MAIKHGLGRGLDALIKDGTSQARAQPAPAAPAAAAPAPLPSEFTKIPVDRIRNNPWQPRTVFDTEALSGLASSIREQGVLEPLLVRKIGNEFELISGQRRLMASREAGLKEIPVRILTASDQASLEMTLVENIQRENLSVLEEAQGYQVLSEKFTMTQEQISARVGKSRAAVANALRILSLPPEVKGLMSAERISAGHAKVLLSLQVPQEQILFANRVVKENLSVRNLEKLIERVLRAPRKPRVSKEDIPANHINYLADKLHAHYGTSVRLAPCRTLANGKKARGTIEIDFYSNDDLTRILEVMGVTVG